MKKLYGLILFGTACAALAQPAQYSPVVNSSNLSFAAPSGTKLWDSNSAAIKLAIGQASLVGTNDARDLFFSGALRANALTMNGLGQSWSLNDAIQGQARFGGGLINMGDFYFGSGYSLFWTNGNGKYLQLTPYSSASYGGLSLLLTNQQSGGFNTNLFNMYNTNADFYAHVRSTHGFIGNGGGLSNLQAGTLVGSGAPYVPQTNGIGTNAEFLGTTTFDAPTNVYGSLGSKIRLQSNNGPAADAYNGAFRFFGGTGDYEFWDQAGLSRFFRIDATSKIARAGQESGSQIAANNPGPTIQYPQRTFNNFYADFHGGSAAGMADLPSPAEALWARKPLPGVTFTSWFLNHETNSAAGGMQNVMTNAIRVLWTNVVPWITNSGSRAYVEVEAWTYTNANKSLNRQFDGNVWWSTNRFTDGIPWLCSYGLSNGNVGVIVQMYYDNTNGISTIENGANGSGTVTIANRVQQDVLQVGKWGVAGIRVADVSQAGYYEQLCNQWDSAILAPNSYPISPTNGIQNAVASAVTNQLFVEMDVVAPPMPPRIPFAMNNLILDQPFGANGNGNPGNQALYELRAWYTNFAYATGRGHRQMAVDMSDGTTVTANITNARAAFTAGALAHGEAQVGFNTNLNATWIQCFTNNDWRGIWLDPAQMPGMPIYDLGQSNLSCWFAPLQNGDFAVALVNHSGANQAMGFAFAQLTNQAAFAAAGARMPTFSLGSNATCSVRDVWAQSTLGVFAGTFTNSLVPAWTVQFLRLTPVAAQTAGVAVNPVQSSSTYGFYERDSFARTQNSFNGVGDLGWFEATFGGGGNQSIHQNGTWPRIGICRIGNSTATSGFGAYIVPRWASSGDVMPFDRPDLWTSWFMDWSFRLQSPTTTNFVGLYIGLEGGANWAGITSDPSSGIYIRWDTASENQSKFAFIIKNGATVTTNYTVTADTSFHDVRIYNDTGVTNIVRCSFDGGAPISVTNALGTTSLGPIVNVFSRGSGGTPAADLDFYDFGINAITQ